MRSLITTWRRQFDSRDVTEGFSGFLGPRLTRCMRNNISGVNSQRLSLLEHSMHSANVFRSSEKTQDHPACGILPPLLLALPVFAHLHINCDWNRGLESE